MSRTDRPDVERFDYAPLGGDLAILRLLMRLRGPVAPADATLAVTRPAAAGTQLYAARDCALERRLVRPDTRGLDQRLRGAAATCGTELLWHASFALPLEIVETPGALFCLRSPSGPAVSLPAPGRRAFVRGLTLADPGDAVTRPLLGRNAAQRLAALATAVAVTATSAPAAAGDVTTDAQTTPAPATAPAAADPGAPVSTTVTTDAASATQTTTDASSATTTTPAPAATGDSTTTTATTTTAATTTASSSTTTAPAPPAATTPAPAGPPPPVSSHPMPASHRPARHARVTVRAKAPATAHHHHAKPIIAPAAGCTSFRGGLAALAYAAGIATAAAAEHRTLRISCPPHQHPPAAPAHHGAPHGRHPDPPRAPHPTVVTPPSGLHTVTSFPGAGDGGAPTATPTSPVPVFSTGPTFSAPRTWTGTVTPDPTLSGSLGNLAGVLGERDRPPSFLVPIYMEAGRRYHVPWEVLAAINAVESDYGRNLNTSTAGAVGWMQFEPSTWARYGLAVDGHSVPNPYDPRDAVFSAARYLAAAGAARDLPQAIFAYNHAGWYVDEVLARAKAIAAHPDFRRETIRRGTFTVYFATRRRRHPLVRYRGGVLSHYDRLIAAANMVSAADFPYRWGGGHEQPARFGPFDCSGSVSYVVQQAGYKVPTAVSGSLPVWRFPAGPGRVTIFYNPTHTFMRIGNRYFGTSDARPGGGAGWSSYSRLPASYLAQFRMVHLPRLGADSFAAPKPARTPEPAPSVTPLGPLG